MVYTLRGFYNNSNTWSPVSSVRVKNISNESVDYDILTQIENIEFRKWSYKTAKQTHPNAKTLSGFKSEAKGIVSPCWEDLHKLKYFNRACDWNPQYAEMG